MDPDISTLAGTAGTTVVTLMTTDAWHRARDGVIALWRRVHPERADAISDELQATRTDLLAARQAGDAQAEEELRSEWQGRLRRLLASDPDVAVELRQLLNEISPTDSGPSTTGAQIRMQACVSGDGRVFQAGRDQHITEK
ncbi:hypothetical protein [Streptomyces lydicus]|uniref:hypothetical protein n=1 Tax=Streptomyces lydicus TaxID=47763 RepID=UPI0037A545C6